MVDDFTVQLLSTANGIITTSTFRRSQSHKQSGIHKTSSIGIGRVKRMKMCKLTFLLWLFCLTGIGSSNSIPLTKPPSSPLIKFVTGNPVTELTSESILLTERDFLKPRIKRGQSYSYEHESVEPVCPGGQFWHIRALRCVPLRCRGGNQYRDVKTGECIIGLSQQHNNSMRHGVPKTVWRSNFNKSKNPVRYPLPRFKG